MPVILRIGGFRFFFFSNEGNPREPIHIHVRLGGASAKFWIRPVRLATSYGFDARTLSDLERLVASNEELIERAWHEYFR